MKAVAALLALALAGSTASFASSGHGPWHYKGIYLGAKMSRQEIMQQLGVTKYQNNPEINVWRGCVKAKGDCPFNRYGMQSAEWVEFNIGPYCANSDVEEPGGFMCSDPWMASASSSGHGITAIEVFAGRDGTVRAIDIFFDAILARDFFDVVHRQFAGAGFWKSDSTCEGPMIISGYTSPHQPNPVTPAIRVERVCESLTTKRYHAYMTNYDETIAHVTPPMYQGELEMEMLDQSL